MKTTKYACLLGSEPESVATRPIEFPPVRSSRLLLRAAGLSVRVTKFEAVRRALAHGADTPIDGISFIKREFGIDVSPTVFSTYKCRLRDTPLTDLVASNSDVEPRESIETNKKPGEEMLDMAKTIKLLVDQFGAETVHGIVDLFASR